MHTHNLDANKSQTTEVRQHFTIVSASSSVNGGQKLAHVYLEPPLVLVFTAHC